MKTTVCELRISNRARQRGFGQMSMRALLILYITTEVAAGGMGMDTKRGATIYAAYVGSVYLMLIPGGGIADNVLGTGLLRPNVSAIVGSLYGPTDPRRDADFSIFYKGINLGVALAPLICRYQGEKVSRHLRFRTAEIFMMLGLVQYQAHRELLAHVGHAPAFPRETIRKNALLGAPFMAAITVTVQVLYFGPALIQD